MDTIDFAKTTISYTLGWAMIALVAVAGAL